MPIDLVVTYKDGSEELFYIPLVIMRGEKKEEPSNRKYTIAPDWAWVNPNYELVIDTKLKKVTKVTIDPSKRMLDLDSENNQWKKD